jgi:gluconolactonase
MKFCCWTLATLLLMVAAAQADQPTPKIEVAAPSGEGIVSPDAKLQLLYTSDDTTLNRMTEGPAVSPEGAIYFTDIIFGKYRSYIMKFDPQTKKTTIFTDNSGKANGLIFAADGSLLACEGPDYGGRRLSSWNTHSGESKTIAGKYEGKAFNGPNDLCVDGNGRIYFTDPRYAGHESLELEHQAVYMVRQDGSGLMEVTHEVEKPNGVAISRDGKTLYVADHNNGTNAIDPTRPAPEQGTMKIYAFPLGADGLVAGKRKTFYDFGAMKGCDGMCIDANGNVYLTQRDGARPGVLIVNAAGKEVGFIPTGPVDQDPQGKLVGIPSNVEFGIGDEAKVLYITVDMSLYRIPLLVAGYHVQYRNLRK